MAMQFAPLEWWLTDVANRKTTAPTVLPVGDEDGPASSQGEQVDDDEKEVDDEDPMTEEEVEAGDTPGTQDDFERRPASFVPQAHWPRWEGDAS